MGDDQIHMQTASVAAAMGRMATAGQTMAGDWRAIGGEVAGLGGQLGRGDLGAAFLAGYREPAAQVTAAADRCCQEPTALADMGTANVDSYQSVDAGNGNAFRSLSPPSSAAQLG